MQFKPCKIEIERKRGAWNLRRRPSAVLTIVAGAALLMLALCLGLPIING
jgi:hypothetical protein